MSTLQTHRTYRKISSGKAAAILFAAALFAVLISVAIWQVIRIVSEHEERQGKYDIIIAQAGQRNGVDPDLLRAVIWRESNFERKTKGSKGEIGLMQIMPNLAVADWARVKKRTIPARAALYDPTLNIEIGSWFLGRALQHWSKYKERNALALCEYNAGRSRADAWKPEKLNGSVMDRIQIASTKKYVSDILRKYEEYRRGTIRRKENIKSSSK